MSEPNVLLDVESDDTSDLSEDFEVDTDPSEWSPVSSSDSAPPSPLFSFTSSVEILSQDDVQTEIESEPETVEMEVQNVELASESQRQSVPPMVEPEMHLVQQTTEPERQFVPQTAEPERPFIPQAEELDRVRRNLFTNVSEQVVAVLPHPSPSNARPLSPLIGGGIFLTERPLSPEIGGSIRWNERPLSPVIGRNTHSNERSLSPVVGSCTPHIAIAAKPVEKSSPNESDDEGLTCSICFEAWTDSGDHRVSSLRCGHLYGLSCIKRWLSGHDRRCPQCKHKSKCSDIRPLYTRSIKALGTSERDSALAALEKERETRRGLELELAQSRLRYQQAQSELSRLREQINKKRGNACEVVSPMKHRRVAASQSVGPRLSLTKTVDLCREGNCRVMSFLDYCSMVIISQPNLNPLYPGFGLKKLNSLEYRAFELIAVHTKPIRDIAVNPSILNGLVLTASMDKTLKLTSVFSNSVVHSFPVDNGAWSCTWNADNAFQFFAGLQNGKVLLFDTRGSREPLRELICCERGGSPVSSLQYVKMNPSSHFGCGGLIVSQLNGCFFFESCSGGDEYRVNHLSVAEGPYTSVSLEAFSRHIMMTCRPNNQHRNLRHLVCDLSQTGGPKSACHCNVLQTFYGGESNKMLSRGRLIRSPVDRNGTFACFGDESSSSVMIWDVGSGSRLQQLPVDDCILDICPISINNEHFLATLTEKKLNVFKWNT